MRVAMSTEHLFAPVALLEDGWAKDVRITIVDGLITMVARGVSAQAGDAHLRNRVLLPAPVNLHSHAFQRAMAGRNQRRGESTDSFWSWRALMYEFLERLNPDALEAIAALTQIEMCEAGFAAVAEFHYLHHAPGGIGYTNPAEMSLRIVEASIDTGIGMTLLPVAYVAGGADGRGVSGGQLRFACNLERYQQLWCGAADALKHAGTDAVIGIAPHSLRALPREYLAELLSLHGVGPVHIHIAEQTAEVREIEALWGARPVEWLLHHHDLDARWCLVHATHMTPFETIALARSGATVGLCPVTEADLGDGFFGARAFIDAGGVFGIGTDSNVAISLAQELRLLEYGQRLNTQQRNVLADASASTGRTVFDAILAGGARAAGRHSGVIGEGYLADCMTLDTHNLAFAQLSADAILDAWIFSSNVRPSDVWCAGRHVVRDGCHIARERVEARYRKALATLVAHA